MKELDIETFKLLKELDEIPINDKDIISEKRKDVNISVQKKEKYLPEDMKNIIYGNKNIKKLLGLGGYMCIPDSLFYPVEMSNLNLSERKVLYNILRRTLGYFKKESIIDWKNISESTAVKVPNIYKAMKNLRQYNIIYYDDNKKNNIKIELDARKWKDKDNSFEKGIDYFINLQIERNDKKKIQEKMSMKKN